MCVTKKCSFCHIIFLSGWRYPQVVSCQLSNNIISMVDCVLTPLVNWSKGTDWRFEESVYTSRPSQTIHLLLLLALSPLAIAFNAAPLWSTWRQMPLRISTSIQTCSTIPHDAPFKVYRHGYRRVHIRTPSLIVARRTRAAWVLQRG